MGDWQIGNVQLGMGPRDEHRAKLHVGKCTPARCQVANHSLNHPTWIRKIQSYREDILGGILGLFWGPRDYPGWLGGLRLREPPGYSGSWLVGWMGNWQLGNQGPLAWEVRGPPSRPQPGP